MASNQAYLFMIFSLVGIIIGLLFDIFRISRKTIKTNDIEKIYKVINDDKKDISKILIETNKWLDEKTNKLENFNNKIK